MITGSKKRLKLQLSQSYAGGKKNSKDGREKEETALVKGSGKGRVVNHSTFLCVPTDNVGGVWVSPELGGNT